MSRLYGADILGYSYGSTVLFRSLRVHASVRSVEQCVQCVLNLIVINTYVALCNVHRGHFGLEKSPYSPAVADLTVTCGLDLFRQLL